MRRKGLYNYFYFNLDMPYKWQCVIGGIVVVSNGDWLHLIVQSKDEIYI